MNNKRLISLFLLLVIAASVITGCHKENSVRENSPELERGLINLKWYTIVDQPPKDLERVNKEINEYIASKIGITVDIEMIPMNDYNSKIQAIINSGGTFDICFSAGWTNNYITNSKKGAFYPIDDLLETDGKEVYEAVHPLFWDKAKVDGQIFGVPALKELQSSAGVALPKEYIKKYNIDTSKINSIYDLEEYLKKIKENELEATPWHVAQTLSLMFDFEQIVDPRLPVGIEIKKDGSSDKKVVNIYETPTMGNILKLVRRYYQEGYINGDAVMLEAAAITEHKGRKLGAWQVETGPAQEGFISDAFGQEMEYVQLWAPVVKGNPPAIQAISAHSEYPKQAMQFLNLLNTDPELRNMLNYGIEGVHYEKISDNVIRRLPESVNWTTLPYTLGNLFITYTLDTEPEDKWEQFHAFNEEAIKSPTFGFTAETDMIRNEIASVTRVHEEFVNRLATGTVDPEVYLPKMNEKLKEAGIDIIIEEVQKQLDQWLATNK